LGTLNFCQSVPRAASPTPLPISETVWVEALRASCNGETVPVALAWGKMAEAPTLIGVVGADVSSCPGGGRVNEADT
jgi:hypothetical protein